VTVLKVCHVITTLDTGGAELMLARLLPGLREREVDGSVVCLSYLGDVGVALRRDGFDVTPLDVPRGATLSIRPVMALVKALRSARPDVVQSWMYHADLAAGIASIAARNPPVVWGIRQSSLAERDNKPGSLRIARLCARVSGRIPAAIVCGSQAARRSHVDFGYDAARMVVIPNGFDTTRFQPDPAARAAVRAELGIADDAPVIGIVARYDVQKDHGTFFRAADAILHSAPDARFVMCGADVSADNPAFERVLTGAVVASSSFLGLRNDVNRILAAVDVLVCSSRGEGFPNAVGEAMACGVPCVTTDVGDAGDLVGTTGVVVPPERPVELAEAVLRVIAMAPAERRALGAAGRARVLEHYAVGAVVDRYAGLYRAVAKRHRGVATDNSNEVMNVSGER
jgi:glycosyltransferase involved in cell wall biosynthesis